MSLRMGTIRPAELRDDEKGFRGEFRIAGHAVYSGPVTFRPQFKATDKSPDFAVENRNGEEIATARLHRSPGKPENLQIWLHLPGFPEVNLAAFPPDENSSAAERDAHEWRVVYIPRRDAAPAQAA